MSYSKAHKLPKNFYTRGTLVVAKDLIGKILVHNNIKGTISGIIVETEAYTGKDDPSSHSYIGKTKRNEVMFDEGGKVYVYFTYGNHYCFNVVTGKKEQGNAVLIRAVEPLRGIEIMKKNRKTDDIYNLTNGPGKLAQAFGINKELYGEDLLGDKIFIAKPEVDIKLKIIKSPRIGISRNVEKLYRFFVDGNPFVSRKNFNRIAKN